jgi:5S rRNA maturation endonuclease (ribonuclease M5)
MPDRRTKLISIGIIATVLELGAMTGIVRAQKVDKSTPREQRTLALAADEVKQLLLLMDTDKSGKVSRQEFMNFMTAEFDRLDTDKSGELDVNEIAKSQLRPSRPAVGK